jgi:hypothetical protein
MNKFFTDPDVTYEEDIDREMLEACQILRDEFWKRRPIKCLIKEPQHSPQVIEAYDTDASWASLVGPDYVIHPLDDGLAVVMHEEGRNVLRPNVRLYFPSQDKEIIIFGTLIIAGLCNLDLECTIPYEGPWICSIDYNDISKISNYIRDLN